MVRGTDTIRVPSKRHAQEVIAPCIDSVNRDFVFDTGQERDDVLRRHLLPGLVGARAESDVATVRSVFGGENVAQPGSFH